MNFGFFRATAFYQELIFKPILCLLDLFVLIQWKFKYHIILLPIPTIID
jgi:hypothetical protein